MDPKTPTVSPKPKSENVPISAATWYSLFEKLVGDPANGTVAAG